MELASFKYVKPRHEQAFYKERQKQLRIFPLEKDEASNPKIALYNEIVRHAKTYSHYAFKTTVRKEQIERIFQYVVCDYPELFWLSNIAYDNQGYVKLLYSYLDRNSNLDIRTLKKRSRKIRRKARKLTKGINSKTSPFEAILVIYRRLVMNLETNGVHLKSDTNSSFKTSDIQNALYSALVEHKAVFSAYSFAIQYLLQSVGIKCGFIISKKVGNASHSFNAIKIGKRYYYLDIALGGRMIVLNGQINTKDISYDYVCVPYKEFVKTVSSQRNYHEVDKALFPINDNFRCITHEYFRQINAYITNYEEEKMVEIFRSQVIGYKKKEMGRFTIHFRCKNCGLRDYVVYKVLDPDNFERIIEKTILSCKWYQRRKARKLLLRYNFKGCSISDGTPTAYLVFDK